MGRKSNASLYMCKLILISVGAGILFFWLWYGFAPLNVMRDDWLFYGYAESDNMQHYAGWLAFRNEEWAFPLGRLETVSYPQGTQLSFMDSIPWIAILFKLFSGVLPHTFQYFGIYVLFCFVLQFYAALLTFSLYSEDLTKNIFCASLFLLAPILVERAFRHTALASHWIILFSIYLFLRAKKYGHDQKDYLHLLLMILSVGIHPYFLPMVFGLTVATAADLVFFDRKIKKAALLIVLCFPAIVMPAFLLGIFKLSGPTVNLAQGYGYFTANLNSFFNPVSTNIMKTGLDESTYKWSGFLPVLPQASGNYDGFNYLGLGGIVLLILMFVGGFQLFKRKQLWELGKKYIFLIAAMFVFAAYAISNVISLNEFRFTIPIPEWLEKICSIFAASGRIMYPVYYMVFIFALVWIGRIQIKNNLKFNIGIIVFVLLLQLSDLSGMIILKHTYFSEFRNLPHTNHPYDTEYDTPFWTSVAQEYDNLWIVNPYRGVGYGLAEYCAKNNIRTNYMTSNRFSDAEYEEGMNFADEILRLLRLGQIDENSVYVVVDPALIDELEKKLGDTVEYFYEDYYYGKFMILLPKAG